MRARPLGMVGRSSVPWCRRLIATRATNPGAEVDRATTKSSASCGRPSLMLNGFVLERPPSCMPSTRSIRCTSFHTSSALLQAPSMPPLGDMVVGCHRIMDRSRGDGSNPRARSSCPRRGSPDPSRCSLTVKQRVSIAWTTQPHSAPHQTNVSHNSAQAPMALAAPPLVVSAKDVHEHTTTGRSHG